MVRKAAIALVVAFLSLLTAIVTLAAVMIRLVSTGVVALTERISHSKPSKEPEKPALRLVSTKSAPTAPTAYAEQLTTALIGMGFNSSAVRRYVSTVTDEKPMADLIKDGLRALAA